MKISSILIILLCQSYVSFLRSSMDEAQYDVDDSEEPADTCVAVFGDEATSVCQAAAKTARNSNAEGRPPDAVESICEDRRDECSAYAENGDCDRNPGWMIMNCPSTCKACHLRDPAVRCKRENLDMDLEPTYHPGEMSDMFESVVDRFDSKYGITVLSTDPWVVIFDNFLTDSEVKALISTVGQWEKSTDTGLTNEFGETGRILSEGRTSSNAWCTHGCEDHPEVQKVIAKIEEVTYVPRANYESLQILRYERGQKYTRHHDTDKSDMLLACGPRVLTFFLYLSDVEEGGETHFPHLNITVTPKKGRALLWPSTFDYNQEKVDYRTEHEAKPVIKGLKFAANSWIHLYDYERPNLWGCTGVFD